MKNKLSELYVLAQNENIDISCFDLPECRSLSLLMGDKCYIAIDPFALETTADEACILAHELGHCVTGSFYNRYSDIDIRAKHERRADKWAIKKLVPKDELNDAFEHGIVEPWDLAEYFNVTEDFIRKAVEFYKDVA